MKDLHIRARLHCHNHYNTSRFYRIIRGTTATLTYNWSEKGYDYSRLEQITFKFKQWDHVTSFDAFDYLDGGGRVTDDHFEFTFDPSTNELLFITFTFGPEETADLELTTPGNEMQFEIVLRFDMENTDYNSIDNSDAIIVDKQLPIIVADEIFEEEGE